MQAPRIDAGHGCEPSPSVEVTGRGEPVARVIAHTTRYYRVALTEPRDLPPRGFHQPIGGDAEALVRERVCGFDLGATECW